MHGDNKIMFPGAPAELWDGGWRVHMLGAGGVGMAGLARLLSAAGNRVDGCDPSPSDSRRWLTGQGVNVFPEHDPSHVAAAQAVIRSTAVPPQLDELRAAGQRGAPVWQRGTALASVCSRRPVAAVSGTHGKTTAATILAQLLRFCGRWAGYVIGGLCPALEGPAATGDDPLLVLEADESDGTLADYRPYYGVVTNIEFDHMEHFADQQAVIDCFKAFGAAAGLMLVCGSDLIARRLGEDIGGAVFFGWEAENQFSARVMNADARGSTFAVYHGGSPVGETRLSFPGRHHVMNALAALAVCHFEGLPWKDLLRSLPACRPSARRFEIVVDTEDLQVVTDYAHHPTEIRATLETAAAAGRRVVVVFQPHRFTRTRALGGLFPEAFKLADEVILAPVYAASEQVIAGGRLSDLLDRFRDYGRADVRACDSLEDAWNSARDSLRPGDMLLIMGAGSVNLLAERARREWGQPEKLHE